ncbi:uncharacterized protein LOC105427708 isoform X2 [Pogonomyrmex barbatus]|uniref:Uncharacterized protein LOC105427708 isoform X2 n=1 Tax=Pogonomyrmex barbatus TaxID=144034 RepID=A0A6I9WB20_9HYME|nr:uncharacterized protein LOC105427708 isoform X2 [Pogonomyrmex barbatus]
MSDFNLKSGEEEKSDENEKQHETITLILKEERFEVDKQKLISKSQYFAALLSANYLEYQQTEHVIKYEIPTVSLQAFINWIHNDNLDTSKHELNEDFDHLLTLLELSVLFVADNLVEDITDRLEKNYLSRQYLIDIWSLAQKLNINVLQDLALAACLHHFNELPLYSSYELPREDLLKLVGNINMKSMDSHLLNTIQEWMIHHHEDTIPLKIKKIKHIDFVQAIISSENHCITNEFFIHCWDGSNFFELTSFKYPKEIIDRNISDSKNRLIGERITGHGYDLYLCGGEFGIGTGKYNTKVWRYSLISKKWFLEAEMPNRRRHMIAVFLNNKLMLVGGVGYCRQKLDSVDIYDICTDDIMDIMVLRTVTDTCNAENCEYIEKIVRATCLKYPAAFRKYFDETFFFVESSKYDKSVTILHETIVWEHDIIDKLHFHNIPIQNPHKFHRQEIFGTFFTLMDPKLLHAKKLNFIELDI